MAGRGGTGRRTTAVAARTVATSAVRLQFAICAEDLPRLSIDDGIGVFATILQAGTARTTTAAEARGAITTDPVEQFAFLAEPFIGLGVVDGILILAAFLHAAGARGLDADGGLR